MYKEPPLGDIALAQFEKFALDRLRVLKSMEEMKLRGRSDAETLAAVDTLVRDHLRQDPSHGDLHRDQVSHYILRLAYCRTPDLRQWFLTHECELFRYRYRKLDADVQRSFFESAGLPYALIPESELAEVRQQLAAVAASVADIEGSKRILTGATRDFYKVPFSAVHDLVATRRVYLRGGYAYVGTDQLTSLVAGNFRSLLARGLMDLAKRWNSFVADESDRLTPLVEAMCTRSMDDGRRGARAISGQVTIGQLPMLSQRHFPLCMQNLYDALNDKRHLKHWGLQQLSLFLKTIGLPMEQALLFWKQQFAPRTTGEDFDKHYAYNIRHNYGREGNKKDYTEYSCVKLISYTPGPEEQHGCPYKTFGEARLRTALGKMGCSGRAADEVMDKAKNKHYQIACSLAFEGAHKCSCDIGINKPSEYYAQSLHVTEEAEQKQQQAQTSHFAEKPAASVASATTLPAATAAPASDGTAEVQAPASAPADPAHHLAATPPPPS